METARRISSFEALDYAHAQAWSMGWRKEVDLRAFQAGYLAGMMGSDDWLISDVDRMRLTFWLARRYPNLYGGGNDIV